MHSQNRLLSKSSEAVSATVKAHTTGRWAETIFRVLGTRVAKRWQFVSFRGKKKGEWRGVVDVIAIRKNTAQPFEKGLKRGDLFDIILVQVKGGSAKGPSEEDRRRLQKVRKHYKASAVVLFSWKKGTNEFSELQSNLEWRVKKPLEIFG